MTFLQTNIQTLLLWFLIASANVSYGKVTNEYSATTVELTFLSNEKRMSGFIYIAEGQELHPTVLLLHGYPGNEKNLDVAQALRAQGWNVAFFHYRGAWGSEGEFSFRNAEQDVQVVLNYLMDEKNAKNLRIDNKRISIIGHSMGGHMAIAGILDNQQVNCAIAYDGANLGANDIGLINDPKTEIPWKAYSDTLFMLNGWSAEKAVQETKTFARELNLVNRVQTINSRPVLLIGADTKVIPMEFHIKPLLAALKQTKNSKAFFELINDDHSFNTSRMALIDTTANFLSKNCSGN